MPQLIQLHRPLCLRQQIHLQATIQPLTLLPGIFSSHGIGRQMLQEFCSALNINCFESLKESVLRITGSPNSGRSEFGGSHLQTARKNRSLHRQNCSGDQATTTKPFKFRTTLTTHFGVALRSTGQFKVWHPRRHFTMAYSFWRVTVFIKLIGLTTTSPLTTIHLCGPKSLFMSRKTANTKDELEASIDRYIASRQQYPDTPTLLLPASDSPDVNALRVLAHETCTTTPQLMALCFGGAQYFSALQLADDCAAIQTSAPQPTG